MKILILGLISILSITSVAFLYSFSEESGPHLVLRQEIQLLQSNAFKNILREQNLLKRSQILEEALFEIQKLRAENPMQLAKDENAISKIVQNLKAMSTSSQAQYKEGQ